MRTIALYITLLLLTLSAWVEAQISEGGTPPSFAYTSRGGWSDTVDYQELRVPFSVAKLKAQDRAKANDRTPPRIAQHIDVELNMEKNGTWSTLPSGERVWRLHLAAPHATALMLYYSNFYIPQGGKLYIYNPDHTHLLGAYTHHTHPRQGAFATEFVAGDACILEYVASTQSEETPLIAISEVGYGYRGIEVRATGWGSSSSCMVDINCEEGEQWQHEKKGVCRIITKAQGVSYLCSGSLVNNTALDLKPYVLTAHHCRRAGYTDNALASDSDFDQWVFYFHYERKGCNNPDESEPTTHTITGCDVVVDLPTENSSDGMLLLLDSDIPHHYDVYYNGWDRSGNTPQSGVCIHHPNGDAMKISTYTSPAQTTTFEDLYNQGATDAYWNVIFAETINGHSVTAGGSSGSPLFNENHHIVGTLTGGTSFCSAPEGTNEYGKFSSHWNDSVDANFKRFDLYLDPLGLGITNLNGISSISNHPQLTLHDGTKECYIAYQNGQYTYIADCGVAAVTLTVIPPHSNGVATINGGKGNEIHHSFTTNPANNRYDITIGTASYTLYVEQLDKSALLQRWGNIVSVVNNPSNNGGFYFTHFNWYCDGVLMEEENNSYIAVPDDKLTATYRAQIATQTGVWVSTCDFHFEEVTSTKSLLLSAPNPASPLETIAIKSLVPADETTHATLIISTTSGDVIDSHPFTSTTHTLTAPSKVGSYIVTLATPEGRKYSTKLIVR